MLGAALTAVIGIAGYYAYQARTSTKTTTVGPTPSANLTTKPPAATNYFIIKEWGVRAPYSGKLTLDYFLKDGNAWLSSQQLALADPMRCSISSTSGNAGFVGRYLPTDDIPMVRSDNTPAMTAQAFVGQDFAASRSQAPSYSKVGGYYYIYWPGQSTCSDKASAQQVQTQTYADFGSIVKSLQAIQ